MTITLICLPTCSTCRETTKYLEAKGCDIEYRNIKLDPPSIDQLKTIHQKSGLPINRLFNTSGNSYRELNLKDKMSELSDYQKYELLSKDGMLIKRPIIISQDTVIIGFKKEQIDEAF